MSRARAVIHKIVVDGESETEGSEPEIHVDYSDNQQEIGEKSSNSKTKRVVKRDRASYTIYASHAGFVCGR